jgi:hypothetical protein
MEPGDKKLIKRILIASGVLIGIILLSAYIDSVGIFNSRFISFKTKPCETGECTKCIGLDIRGVCLGALRVTTTVEQ